MIDETPSARPESLQPAAPLPVGPETVAPDEPMAEATVAADPAPMSARAVHAALQDVEQDVTHLHASSEVQQGTVNPERLASALTLLTQARERFEEWLSQFV